MIQSTKKAMLKHIETLPAGSVRAQCYTIAGYSRYDGATIAQQLDNDHLSQDGAKRAALIMVDAGCAQHVQTEREVEKHLFGKFIFEDKSELG